MLENSEKRTNYQRVVQIFTSSNIDVDGAITNILDYVEQ